jgi:hypothetical protein
MNSAMIVLLGFGITGILFGIVVWAIAEHQERQAKHRGQP